MNDIQISGPFTSALTHFAGWGLASILEEAGAKTSHISWSLGDAEPRCTVSWSASSTVDAAEAVHQHAVSQLAPHSLCSARYRDGDEEAAAIFSPRVKAPPLEGWAARMAQRDAAIRMLDGRPLSLRLIAALGQPAWWHCDEKHSEPDRGSSRWEMKTRNRGAEFVKDRLAPLADVLSKRTAQEVFQGLTGERMIDELGKGASDSRTATGLQPPGPTDSALAWCALWGLSVFPTVLRVGGYCHSPGTSPRTRVHPTTAVLPVFERPVTPGRVRNVVMSQELDKFLAMEGNGVDNIPTTSRPLTNLGVVAYLRFSIEQTGSQAAPERWLKSGEVHVL